MNKILEDMISYFKKSLKYFSCIHHNISEEKLDNYIKKLYFDMFPEDEEINEEHFDIWIDTFVDKYF